MDPKAFVSSATFVLALLTGVAVAGPTQPSPRVPGSPGGHDWVPPPKPSPRDPDGPAPSIDCAAFRTPVFQRVNPSTGASLVTTSRSEADDAARLHGFTTDLGVPYRVAATSGAGLAPVHRLYKQPTGDFRWASEPAAVFQAVRRDGYRDEGVRFHAASTDAGCLAPVYDFTKAGKTRQAVSVEARNALLADGWSSQGASFYAAADDGVDTVFSIAVIPDSQQEVLPSSNDRFINRTRWLVDNRDAQDLRFVAHIGDITNWGQQDPQQFVVARAAMDVLGQAGLSYAISPGNHDTAAVCAGGSACPGVNIPLAVRDTTVFNQTFPASSFGSVGGTFETGKVDNSFSLFDAGGTSWMVITLELWPRVAAIEWARQVVAAHPRHNVIVVTHSYMDGDGSISQSNGGYGATSPQDLFDHLIKVYPNIRMVFSGHVGLAASRSDNGVSGNRILSFLQCFHSTTNPVRLIEIDTRAGTVTSLVYAPKTDTHYPEYDVAYSGMDFSP